MTTDVQPTDFWWIEREATVEIGGQVMAQAQFDAARYPLLNPDPGPCASALGDQMAVTFDNRPANGTVHDSSAAAGDL